MIQVRRNVFETNSSSTHSLAVPQNYQTWDIKKRKLVFHLGSFGRPCKTVKVKATDYLYTAIMCDLNWCFYADDISEEERDKITSSSKTPDWKQYCKTAVNRLNKLKEILDSYGLKYEFEEPVWDIEYGSSYDFVRDVKYARKVYYTISDVKTGKIENKSYYTDRHFDIDHSSEVEPLIDMLLANPEECIKFLLGGMVFVGSDEADELQCAKVHWNRKTYTEYYYFDTKKNKEVKRYSYKRSKYMDIRERELPNPYYMEGYNYYYKGN